VFEWVWKSHVYGESCKNEISKLHAGRGDNDTKVEVKFAEELGKVVKEYEQHAQRALIEEANAVV
jgi:hypothetical protein